MPTSWSPQEINRIIATTTGCLCLVVIVAGTMLGISTGKISANLLGSATGIGVGGGLVGLSYVIYMVIKAAIRGGKVDG